MSSYTRIIITVIAICSILVPDISEGFERPSIPLRQIVDFFDHGDNIDNEFISLTTQQTTQTCFLLKAECGGHAITDEKSRDYSLIVIDQALKLTLLNDTQYFSTDAFIKQPLNMAVSTLELPNQTITTDIYDISTLEMIQLFKSKMALIKSSVFVTMTCAPLCFAQDKAQESAITTAMIALGAVDFASLAANGFYGLIINNGTVLKETVSTGSDLRITYKTCNNNTNVCYRFSIKNYGSSSINPAENSRLNTIIKKISPQNLLTKGGNVTTTIIRQIGVAVLDPSNGTVVSNVWSIYTKDDVEVFVNMLKSISLTYYVLLSCASNCRPDQFDPFSRLSEQLNGMGASKFSNLGAGGSYVAVFSGGKALVEEASNQSTVRGQIQVCQASHQV